MYPMRSIGDRNQKKIVNKESNERSIGERYADETMGSDMIKGFIMKSERVVVNSISAPPNS